MSVDMSSEVWRPVEGLPSNIQVSNYGNVRKIVTGKEPEPVHLIYSSGRITVSIKSKQYYVHRLVALAFLPNPGKLGLVIHLDRNKLNNRADNLQWASRSEDAQKIYSRAVRNGLLVRCVETGVIYSTIYSVSAYTGIHREAIVANLEGKTDSCFGFHFEYVPDDENVHPDSIQYRSYLQVVSASAKYNSFFEYLKAEGHLKDEC